MNCYNFKTPSAEYKINKIGTKYFFSLKNKPWTIKANNIFSIQVILYNTLTMDNINNLNKSDLKKWFYNNNKEINLI